MIHQFRIYELMILCIFADLSCLKVMRPLIHPSLEEMTVEGILYALSDPVRVAIYTDIVAQELPQTCSTFLTVADKSIPKSTLSLHFKVLREAGLIQSERHGVEVRNRSRCAELEQRFPGLVKAVIGAYSRQSITKARESPRGRKKKNK